MNPKQTSQCEEGSVSSRNCTIFVSNIFSVPTEVENNSFLATVTFIVDISVNLFLMMVPFSFEFYFAALKYFE